LNKNHEPILSASALAALLFGVLLWVGPSRAYASPDPGLWQEAAQAQLNRPYAETWVQPKAFRTVSLDHAKLQPLLNQAAREPLPTLISSGALISLPMPDGTHAQFRFVEAPVMHPDLAARFPEIKTYRGRGVDDPAATVRFDLTPAGFHAQVLSPKGAAYIEPYLRGDTNLHTVYFRRDHTPSAPDFQCLASGTVPSVGNPGEVTPAGVSGGGLRTYRLACAATAEYVKYFGARRPRGDRYGDKPRVGNL